jgi:hypothetical protein
MSSVRWLALFVGIWATSSLYDRHQLGGLGLGRTGHARELVVEAEVVLQRDRGESLVLVLDLDILLGLDRLVHALVVAAALTRIRPVNARRRS